MSPFSPRDLLDFAARQEVNEEIDLCPRISAALQTLTPSPDSAPPLSQLPAVSVEDKKETIISKPSILERSMWMQTLRAKPVLIALILIFALAMLSGAAYALSRSLGYLPGVGIIEQGSPIRVLAEPISQTQQGITLTVQEATLTAERTVIVYTQHGVPREPLAQGEDLSACHQSPQLRLPNGDTLTFTAGRGGIDMQGRWEFRLTYPPLPVTVNEAEFFVPCLHNTRRGKAPENWVFPLRFVPAPPDLTVLPVQEISTPVEPSENNPTTSPTEGWRIQKVIETEEGYLLVGSFHLSNLPYRGMALGFSEWPSLTDAQDNPLPFRPAKDIDLTSSTPGEIPWSLEIQGKQLAWPLTLQARSVDVETSDLTAEFTFDAGTDPAVGQEWAIQRALPLGDWQIVVQKVRFTGTGYDFEIYAPEPLRHVGLEIMNAEASGGYGEADDQGNVRVGLEYKTPPLGQITVRITRVIYRHTGDWQIQWMPPENGAGRSLFGIQLVLEKTVESKDGYYLIGRLRWDDDRIQSVSPATELLATDAQGKRLELELVSFDLFNQLVPNFTEADWVYHLTTKSFEAPLTLHLEKINLMLRTPIPLGIDLRPDGFAFDETQVGSSYEMRTKPAVGLPDLYARLIRVSYTRQGELHGFELLFEADPNLSGLTLQPAEGFIDLNGESRLLIESYLENGSGWLVSRLLTDRQMTMPLTFTVLDFQLRGDWSVEFQPLQNK